MAVPTSAGVPLGYARETLVAEYNDLASVEALFDANVNQVAAVIVGTGRGQHGRRLPCGRLPSRSAQAVRRQWARCSFSTRSSPASGVAYGGAQERYRIRPDLTCLGKIIGGGLPVGAYGGRADVMQMAAPLGPAYQAGTLSGNPLATAAGIVCLRELAKPGVYDTLEALGAEAEAGLRAAGDATGVAVTVNRVGSALTAFFTESPVTTWEGSRVLRHGPVTPCSSMACWSVGSTSRRRSSRRRSSRWRTPQQTSRSQPGRRGKRWPL